MSHSIRNNKLSIIIPNYNYDTYIGKTIESIISQNYKNIEIIVIDDGSTDNSVEVINRYKEKFPTIINFVKQSNVGQANTINNGFKIAKGDIIGWINSDDSYCNDSIAKVMGVFNRDPNVDIVFGDINIIDINDNYMYKMRHFNFSYFLSVFCGFSNNISSNAVFWKKSIMEKHGHLNPNFKCGLDNEYFSRITFKANIHQIRVPIANFRKQPISKAAIGHNDWIGLMKQESNFVFEQSYSNLFISRLIPFTYAKGLRICILIYRKILKLISGRILFLFIEKYKYKKRCSLKTLDIPQFLH